MSEYCPKLTVNTKISKTNQVAQVNFFKHITWADMPWPMQMLLLRSQLIFSNSHNSCSISAYVKIQNIGVYDSSYMYSSPFLTHRVFCYRLVIYTKTQQLDTEQNCFRESTSWTAHYQFCCWSFVTHSAGGTGYVNLFFNSNTFDIQKWWNKSETSLRRWDGNWMNQMPSSKMR